MGVQSFSVFSNSATCVTTRLPSPYPSAKFSPWQSINASLKSIGVTTTRFPSPYSPAKFSPWQSRNASFKSIRITPCGSSNLQMYEEGRSQDPKAASNLCLEDASIIDQEQHKIPYLDGDILRIKRLFSEIGSRQASVSAYDTAWVAMVPSLENSQSPQFPQCLSWIMANQLQDGSWGISELPYVKDRLLHTLACIIALRTWNVGNNNMEMGLRFIRENIEKIAEEAQYNPIGFDIIFAAMMDDARALCLELPYDSTSIKLMRKKREEILKSIELPHMNEYDGSLIYIVEGIRSIIDWNKVLIHQSKDGSLFHSPSATACALMHTRKLSCLKYLNSILQNVGNGVPSVYSIYLFTGISMADRLERLGIARHFKCEINQTLDYVYRCWTRNEIIEGISSTSDMVNSSISFKLLRCNGYDVSPDFFLNFLRDGDFLPSVEKSGQGVTAMLNLYKASQVMFLGENILEEAESLSGNYLAKRQEKSTLSDQNIVIKDLEGEVQYALRVPWLVSLPRLEQRKYIDQYGVDDIWIGKTSYKIPCISNELFLTLAKKDYNICQAIQQKELQELEKWFVDAKFGDLNFARQKLLYCFYSVSSIIFTPEMSALRKVWTKNSVLVTIIDDFYDLGSSTEELQCFLEAVRRWDPAGIYGLSASAQIVFFALYNSVNDMAQIASDFQGRDVSIHYRKIYYRLGSAMMKEAEWSRNGNIPSLQEYIENGKITIALEPILLSLYLAGPKLSEEIICGPEYINLMDHVSMCGRLLNDVVSYEREARQGKLNCVTFYMKEHPSSSVEDVVAMFRKIIDETAHKLLKVVLQPSGLPLDFKQMYWNMFRTVHLFCFKTDGFTSPTEMLEHVKAVIFHPCN